MVPGDQVRWLMVELTGVGSGISWVIWLIGEEAGLCDSSFWRRGRLWSSGSGPRGWSKFLPCNKHF